ncbi:MAG: hypothetical protein WD627_01805 [Actinomycetota bacterium]
MIEAPGRISPFTFPSDTSFRFVLLIVMVLSASLFCFDSIHVNLHGKEMVQVLSDCFAEANAQIPEVQSMEDNTRRVDFVSDCRAGFERSRAAFMSGGALGVAVGAGYLSDDPDAQAEAAVSSARPRPGGTGGG